MLATENTLTRQLPGIGGCHAVEPHVRPPTPRQLGGMDEADRALLARVLSEPAEYIDHAMFRQPDAEQILFGERTARQGGSTRLAESRRRRRPGGEVPALHGSREVLLFQRFNFARLRIAELVGRYAGKAMPTDAVRELLAWARQAEASRSQIVQSNIPLVLAMAKRTRLSGLDFNELISEGNFALLRSVDKFDCSRGFKFSTYACRAILKSFSRVALRTSRYRGRFPTEFDPSLEKSDYVDRKRDDVETQCVEEIREILAENRADLNEMEQTVIRQRFALYESIESPRPKTLEQVGELIGVTKERVRQIQNKALRKLRAILEDSYLTI